MQTVSIFHFMLILHLMQQHIVVALKPKYISMKKTLLSVAFIAASLVALAQDNVMATDQNPNYHLAKAKYTQNAASLQSTNHETVQRTYEAYDFYASKVKERNDAIAFRRQLALIRAQNYGNYWQPYQYRRNNNYFGGYNQCNRSCCW